MEKFLLFTTGGGSADPLNWSSDEAALYSTSELKGMKPASSRSIDLFFETTYGKEIVTLGIKNSTHGMPRSPNALTVWRKQFYYYLHRHKPAEGAAYLRVYLGDQNQRQLNNRPLHFQPHMRPR